MNTPRPISPILDGFLLGDCANSHGANQCCPATEKATGKKFILKMISVPDSAVQMDAVLMTGAFSDRSSANAYYKEQARAVLNEAKTLRYLATLSHFTDFDSVQVVPVPAESGFEVYLLAPRRTSLHKLLVKSDLTQREIVNMAIDLCTALSACRHAGYCYVNLKPNNIFHIGSHCCIGDLGFVPLSSVGTAALPEKYRSAFTPPELLQDRTLLNDTADTYALGLILYSAYNGGVLPSAEDLVGRLYAPPKYADYEMARIILRACAPDPSIRYRDPEQMLAALSLYLQRNGIQNTPVVPAFVQKAACVPEPFLPEEYDPAEFALPLWPDDSGSQRKKKRRSRLRSFPLWPLLLLAAVIALIALILALQ